MNFSRTYVILSEVALIAALPGVLLLQLFCVLAAWETGEEFPEVRHLVVPYALAAVAALICVQILIVALMMLVRAVSKGDFFTAKTMKWINLASHGCYRPRYRRDNRWAYEHFYTGNQTGAATFIPRRNSFGSGAILPGQPG